MNRKNSSTCKHFEDSNRQCLLIAKDKEELKRLGITHVLNAAHSSWECTDLIVYDEKIHYYGITAEDCPEFDISVYFYPAAEYIHNAISMPHGKILVHCVLGKSRSASLVLAYLMIYHHLSLENAIRKVIQYRAISPNRGFLKHLQDLDIQLHRQIKICKLV
ncbi:dual specificity protein phosphatase 26-like isoform X2 [Rhinatrema bivittatum]|uniref:dual specificity protein phosphatase 26-like isoform X2 n=1 Tax=Rhinatrema bivittatum TaxID=194408 RepID=UPI001125FFAE|nr:dual specificity protein phosphatase 26-like isoform X2 [Rhinatrema bivittatum]